MAPDEMTPSGLSPNISHSVRVMFPYRMEEPSSLSK